MSTKKATKRALLTSILAICLCLVMLIGSTFAWFTDTASTGVNKIESGTLKVALEMKNPAYTGEGEEPEWISAEGQTLQFLVNGKVPAKNEDGTLATILWEPGCTYELQPVRVRNDGNLALKYKVEITGIEANRTPVSGEPNLNDVIEWTIVTSENNDAVDKDDKVLPGEYFLLPSKTTGPELTIKGHMKEEAGNDYQGLFIENVAITVYATQYTYESDSNDKWYDANAAYGNVSYSTAATPDELNEALANPKDANGEATDKVAVKLEEGKYTLKGITNKTVAITGTKDVVIDMENSGNGGLIGNQNHDLDITFDGVTVEFANENYKGITHSKKVTYKNCTITGKQFLYANDVEFINCTFENSGDYCVWTYGSTNVLFDNCVFNTTGKAVLVYREGDGTTNVTANDCTFNGGTSLKAAIETGDNPAKTYVINLDITNATLNGYTKAWGNKNNMPTERLSVTLDGIKAY